MDYLKNQGAIRSYMADLPLKKSDFLFVKRFIFLGQPWDVLARRILRRGLANAFKDDRFKIPIFRPLDFFQLNKKVPTVAVIEKKDHPLSGIPECFIDPYLLDSPGYGAHLLISP